MESTQPKFVNENVGADQPAVKQQRNMLPVLILTVIVIFALISVFLYISARAKESKVLKIDEEITQINAQIKSKDQLERAVVAIYGQVTNLDSVLAKRNFWSNLLNQIKSTASINIQLQSVSTTDLSKVQITGKTSSYASLSYYLKSLENSTKVSNVNLVSSSTLQEENTNKIQFTISAAVSASVVEKSAAKTSRSN